MSRTDAHRPGWVQANDPLVPRREHHDHRDGICDLGPSTNDAFVIPGWRHRHCFWDVDWTLVQMCCCHMCHPKYEHGKDRAYWRDRLRELTKTQGREDIDIAPFIDKGW
jgi:hypothetical protein